MADEPLLPDAAALALVPGLEGGAAPLRLERLAGGTVNDSWRVDTDRGRFVLRSDGPGWRRPGVDREREQLLHEAAAAGGLAPSVVCRDLRLGAQVSEYLDGRTWGEADLANRAALARLAARLAALHAIAPPGGVARFDPIHCARDYLERVDPAVRASSGAEAMAARVADAARRVGARAGGLAIVHGDLVPANLLEGKALWLLDWEYAQLADPLYDFGCLLAYHPELRSRSRWLLDAAGHGGADVAARLAAAVEVYEALSGLWLLARDQGSPAQGS